MIIAFLANQHNMIFPATLIISDNDNAAIASIKDIYRTLNHNYHVNDPDSYRINAATGWGIDQIRLLKKFLSNKPYSSNNKIIIITQAENLLLEAQNALLKTLEEPGPDNYLILTTSKPSSLLPTVLSRCHLIRNISKTIPQSVKSISPSTNLLNDLKKSEELSLDKDAVLPLLENQLKAYQQQLSSDPSPETVRIIKKIIKSILMIRAHVDPKSALDFFFLS